MRIARQDALLLLVDLQEKLAPAIHGIDEVLANALRLMEGAGQLGVPRFVSEQYVRGLGRSVPALRNFTVDTVFFEKTHFSCVAEPGILPLLQATGRRQIILAGTEAHVCVLQTALDLLAAGFTVFLVVDAIGSRQPGSSAVAVTRLVAAGAIPVTTEMVLFECLERAATDEFRALLPLIK